MGKIIVKLSISLELSSTPANIAMKSSRATILTNYTNFLVPRLNTIYASYNVNY